MNKRGRPPKPMPSVPIGRMDDALAELAKCPVESMPDLDYVSAHAASFDRLLAQRRSVREIVDFLTREFPEIGRKRLTAMVETAAERYRARVETSASQTASLTLEEQWDNFGKE